MQKKIQGLLPRTLCLLRKKCNLTQKEMANVMGVSVGMYNKIELGERTVKNDLIPILAKTLNTDTCTINSLYLADTFYREATQYSKEVVGRALDILCDNLNHLKK